MSENFDLYSKYYDLLYGDKEYNSDKILVVLQDQNSRNLINKYKNTGVKIET